MRTRTNVRRTSLMAALTPAAALLILSGQAMASPMVCPSWPIAITRLSFTASDPYGPNQDGTSAYFSNLTTPAPSISRTGLWTGTVMFRADTNVVAASGAGGLWLWNGSNTNVVERTDAAPTTGSYTTAGFNNPIVNTAGQYAFRDGSSTTGALYAKPAATLGRLLAVGDTAPGTGGATFSAFGSNMYLNASGSAVTLAGLTTNTGSPPVVANPSGANQLNMGYWAGSPGSLSLLVRQTDSTNVANVQVGSIDGSAYAYNDNGKLLWTGNLQGTGVNTSAGAPAGVGVGTSQGLMSTRNGFAEVIARRGDSFPDFSGATYTSGTSTDGVAYRTITGGNALDMNNAGRVVYSSTLRTSAADGGNLPSTNGNIALFSDNTGTNRMIARDTKPMPAMTGLATGLNWGTAYSQVAINNANTIAFNATGLTGTDPVTGSAVTSAANSGLFKMNSAGNFTKVFRSNDAAPANPDPALSSGTVLFSSIPTTFAMNALGQMAFVESLGGTGISTNYNLALFGVDSNGNFCLIAQRGMLFHVGDGDDRIVNIIGSLSQSGNEDGRVSNLDDGGTLVFSLTFSNTVGGATTSSGVFYTHIPAPGSAMLLGMGGLISVRRRRR